MKPKIKASYLFPNGMVVTFDTNGEQVGELQGRYTEDLHLKVFISCESEALMYGFPDTIKMLINKKGDSLTENHKIMKKSTFLAGALVAGIGVSKLTLRDVNGGDGLNDFRSGTNTGDIKLDFYGDSAADITPGDTYLLRLEKYVEPAATTDENGDAPAGSAIAKTSDAVPTGPQSFTFNDQLSVLIENGVATLQIFGQALTAPLDTESEDNADTQDQGSASADAGITQTDVNNAGSQSADNAATGQIPGSVQSDTNTQDNAGPAAGAESSENSGPVDTDTSNQTV